MIWGGCRSWVRWRTAGREDLDLGDVLEWARVIAMYFDADEPCIGIVNVVVLKAGSIAAGLSVEHLVPAAVRPGASVDGELGNSGVTAGPCNSDIVEAMHRAEVDVNVSIVAFAGPAGAEVAVDDVLWREVLVRVFKLADGNHWKRALLGRSRQKGHSERNSQSYEHNRHHHRVLFAYH